MFREKEGTEGIDLKGFEGIGVVDLGGGLFGM